MSEREKLVEIFEKLQADAMNAMAGSEKQNSIVESMARVAEAIRKIDADAGEQYLREQAQINELASKDTQLAQQAKDQLISHAIEIGTTVICVSALMIGYFTSIKLEYVDDKILSTETGRSAQKSIFGILRRLI